MWCINFNLLRSRQRKSNLKGIIVQAKILLHFYATLIRGRLNISNAVPSAIFDPFANFFLLVETAVFIIVLELDVSVEMIVKSSQIVKLSLILYFLMTQAKALMSRISIYAIVPRFYMVISCFYFE